jgi:2-keto-3-deoxy-L-rhamnonate aldolase RhmA
MAVSLRQRLLSGGRSYGPFLMSDSPAVAELLAGAGYGHVVIDHEHGPTDVRSGLRMLRAVQAAGAASALALASNPKSSDATNPVVITEAVVRVPSPDDPAYMKKVLDTLQLPAGVLVPMVDSAEMAADVVRSTRYPAQQRPPLGGDHDDGDDDDDDETRHARLGGIRGNAWPLARASRYGANAGYVGETDRDLLVMVQVETPRAVEAIPDIARVPGVDAIFLGPLDLSTGMGKMGRYEDDEVASAIRGAERAVLRSGCLLAGFRPPGRELSDMFMSGYSFVAGSADLGLLRDAAARDLADAAAAMRGAEE